MTDATLATRELAVTSGAATLVGPVSFEARPGRVTALLGPNGSGKTSLLRALAGLRAYSGHASLGGDEIASLDPRVRATRVAYVPQQSALEAALRVRSVVAQGRFAISGGVVRSDHPAVDEAMRRADVLGLADRTFPTLSLGEQRRVLIARAVATGASCFLLDEPDAYLDVGQRLRLFSLLHQLRDDGATLLVVVHALLEAREHADACVVLDRGRIVAEGAPREALSSRVLRDVFGVDAIEDAAPRFVLPQGGAS